ncbi:cutinase family protein [Nocardia sp. NBC_01503]|uniref:cutinase family protein n=1 Tax=Nocardia sp. NBC_01503 TaxID=2975997 RepID=UPI002E7C2F01|nr:cutinase family protein [Nocardia sp. NBC_01503]WTL33446.1 cutinase family protein [Nocardia sp. NBC_01503]
MSRLATSCGAISVAAAVMVGTVAVGGAHADIRGTAPCTPYTAILAPGTWETRPDADPAVPVGMLRPVGDGLQRQFGSQITVRYTPYAASAFDQGLSYAESLSTLESRLRTMVGGLCASTRVLLAGYSQGADGIGDFATEIGNGEGPIGPERVIGVGLLADPHRDPNTTLSLGNPQPGHGIAGTRSQDFGALTDRVRTLCADGDLYCSLNANASPFLAALGRVLSGDPAPIAALVPTTTDPSTLIEQVVKVGAGWAATAANLPTILDDLTSLPTIIQTGDVRTAHEIASNLNIALAPMVQAAAGVDLSLIASVVRAATAVDPSGFTSALSVVADALTGIDILGIAANVGQVQETLWRAVESLNRNDPLAAASDVASLAPTAVNLASSVIGPFATAVRGDLRVAAQTLLDIGGPDSVNDLVQLSRQGVAMANFYASNAHLDYGDDAQILLNFLGAQADS